jgi:excisionase family DNA binding protein
MEATSETPPTYQSRGPVHDVKSASERGRVNRKTVLTALRNGDLKGNQMVAGGKWRIFEADLDEWIARPRTRRRRRASA